MKFELEVGANVKTVQIRRHGDAYEVTVDGRTRLVDAVHIAGSAWSLLVRDAEGDVSRSVDAAVIKKPASSGFDVHINGFHYLVRSKSGLGRSGRAGSTDGLGAGPHRVAAPMPGKVVRVLVNRGEQVKSRQGLVVVEAMKMENELRATRDGRVREVLVTEGQSVEAGAPLVVVD